MVFRLHSQFGRLAFFGHRIPQLPYGHQDRYCPTQESLSPLTSLLTIGEHRCARRREGGVNWKWWARGFADASVALVLLLADAWGPRSLAHGRFDYVVWALSYWVTVLIVNDVAVAVLGWWLLERLCLQPLKQSHLRWGFSWIKGFSWRRIWTSYRSMSPEVMFDYMMRLNESNQRVGGDGELQTAYTNLRARYYEPEHGRDEAWADRIAAGILTVHEELARVATAKLVKLCEKWDMDQGAVTGREEKRGLHNEYPIDKDNPGREEALVRMADEEFAALLYLGYIRMALIQIRNRIVTASVTYVLLLWALTSYPWMNRHAILLALCLLLGLISAATRIGAQIIGDDGETVPPAQDMAQHGLVNNIVGYSLYGDQLSQNPSAQIITAVANGEVDLAVAWGPMAAYFAGKSTIPLQITPISPTPGVAALPVAFSISMGVMAGNTALRDQLNQFIVHRQREIRALLLSYQVPLLESGGNANLPQRTVSATGDAAVEATCR